MIIPTRPNEKEDLALFFRLANDPAFQEFRKYLKANLDFLRKESDQVMDSMRHEDINKGVYSIY